MNSIKVGKIYTACVKKSGEDWELLVTRDEKGHNDISVFVSNYPSLITEGGKFRVEGIESLSLSYRQDENGRWWPNVRISATVEAAGTVDGEMEEIAPRPAPKARRVY